MDISLRLAAGVALMAGCTLFGRGMTYGIRKRIRFLEELIRGVQSLERSICLRRVPLAQAMAESGCTLLQEMGLLMKAHAISPQEAWQKLRAGQRRESVGAEDEVLHRLFADLGQGDLAAQQDLLLDIRKNLEELLHRQKIRQQETGKLYPALGALTGMALAVLLY